MNDCVVFDSGGETSAAAATAALTRRGFRVVRSFDLRSATAAHVDCECPYHGTAQCTCQFVVLLVYGEGGDPVVVTADSHGAQARVQIVRDEMARPHPRLIEKVMAALVEAALTLQAAPVVEVNIDAE